MRVILANYGQADNNSAYHIFRFARGLAERGHEVRVALAKLPPEAQFAEVDGFRIASHRVLQQHDQNLMVVKKPMCCMCGPRAKSCGASPWSFPLHGLPCAGDSPGRS